MINDETTHWAGQQDRVDDFVFQRLSSEEMDTYKRHLEKCAHCALLVQNEQQLIKGIKRYGRSQLKSRLQEQISKQDFSHIEWKRFVSIAAVIILVSTSAAYFFFLTHNHNANSRSREIVLQEQHQSLWLIGKVVIKNEPFHGKLAKDNWTFRLRRENSSGVLHIKKVSLANLPQEKQKQDEADNIQSLLERTSNGIELTVYIDHTDQSHLAGIEPTGEASFILYLEGKQIAYQLPDGWI